MSIEDIAQNLEKDLPNIITKIAYENNSFEYLKNPDFLEKRLLAWHQFGLLSHTKKVREIYKQEMPAIIKKWGLFDYIQSVLSDPIHGINKGTLFEISIPLHDLGKIVCKDDKSVNRKHEESSAQLIFRPYIKKRLYAEGLKKEHIAYIFKCVLNHDALGKELRDKLKHERKLSLDYLKKENITPACIKLAIKYNEIKTEMGIFFLCDLLGKTDLRIEAISEEGISKQETEIEKVLIKRNLPLQLKSAVLQLPANLKLAEIYLREVSSF